MNRLSDAIPRLPASRPAAWISTLVLCILAAGSAANGQAPLEERKSIHQAEAEAHRDVRRAAVTLAAPPQALPATTPPNREHTVFGFYPYWTGLSIANAGAETADVAVEALDEQGRSLGTYNIELPPGRQETQLLYQWIPGTLGLSSGRVEIRSTAPVLATEIFGSDALSFITAVPGKP